MRHLRKYRVNENFYISKSKGFDYTYNVISEKDGSIVCVFEYNDDDLLMSPLSTWRKFTIEELSEILNLMQTLEQTDKYNL